MTKYLMILAAVMVMVGCGEDPVDIDQANNDPVDNNSVDNNSQPDTDTEQPDVDTNIPWVTDQTFAGLEWSPLSEKEVKWQAAMNYCEAMGARLPNINELRKIIIHCQSTYGGACGISDPDHLSVVDWSESCRCDGTAETYAALGDGKYVILWSSSRRDDWSPLGPITQAWVVDFNYGYINTAEKGDSNYARCVR